MSITQSQLKVLKKVDSDVRTRVVDVRAAQIYDNTPVDRSLSERMTIARNVIKWNMEKHEEVMILFAKKSGIRDAERVLYSEEDIGSVLTRSSKVFVIEEDEKTMNRSWVEL